MNALAATDSAGIQPAGLCIIRVELDPWVYLGALKVPSEHQRRLSPVIAV